MIRHIRKLSQTILNDHEISQKDIGVVTPYNKQVQVIRDLCDKNDFQNVTIGTAEVFQGQEKPVIIISTVGTNGVVGFTDDPRVRPKLNFNNNQACNFFRVFFSLQRFNVMVTRPKCLLILVGDVDDTLSEAENWKELIDFCKQKDVIIANGRKLHGRIQFPPASIMKRREKY